MREVILEATAVEKRFAVSTPLFGDPVEVHAIAGVSLKIEKGETFAIVGESGCGKSTLARLLVRLLAPSDGSVHYRGRNIATIEGKPLRDLRRELQFIFQDPFSSLNPRMTVGALIEEPLRAHGIGTKAERKARVADLLSRVGLPAAAAQRFPHEFSGGQRQRIGIARALATRPSVLVGDEPVSALDVSIQAQVVNILQDLKDEFGLTLIVIAHDLAVIRHMADRVAVMYLGEVVELASAADLFAQPRHPYTAALLAAIPRPEAGVRPPQGRVEGDLPNPISPPPGCRFHPRCPYAVDICKTERPRLTRAPDGREVACHRAEELTLDGVAAGSSARSSAAQTRFDLWRKARAADAPNDPAARQEGGPPRIHQGEN